MNTHGDQDDRDSARTEEILRGMLDSGSEPHMAIDPDGQIIYANRAACEHFGPTFGELTGTSIASVVDHLQPGKGTRLLEKLPSAEPFSIELEVRAPSLGFRSIDASPLLGGCAIRFRQGQTAGPGDDSAERYALFFESGPLPMWIFESPSLKILDVNLAAVVHYGYSREEFLSMTLRELRPPDELPTLLNNAQEPVSPTPVSRGIFKHRKRDGTIIESEVFVRQSTFRGRPVNIALAHDVTERKQMAEALAASQAELAAIVKGMGDVVLVLDDEGRVRDVAPTAAPELYRPSTGLAGKRLHDVVPAEVADRLLAAVRVALEQQSIEYVQYSLQFDETVVWFSGAASPISDDTVVWVAREITEMKRYEEVLAEAKGEADKANRAKNEFLSRMSHELRTPLNSVLGFAQLLRYDATRPEQQDNVDQILSAGGHLLDLINEVLDIARIESGNLSLSNEPVELAELVGDTLSLLRPIAREYRIGLPEGLTGQSELYVLGDRQRIKQVVLNLVSNAIKYNRPGGMVRVRCEHRPDHRLRLYVADMGPGIAAEKVSRLFMAFDRLGAEKTEVEGTGLGLALSKALIEAMNGELGVDTELGKGSEFWLELPLAKHERASAASDIVEAAPPDTSPAVQRRVLYIEDNPANVKLVQRILVRRPGVELISAMRGMLGLDVARNHEIDLVLLDLNLPDVRGDELLVRLKADPRTASIPVVVLTADATPSHVKQLLASGARDVLTKPFVIEYFLSMIDATVSRDRS